MREKLKAKADPEIVGYPAPPVVVDVTPEMAAAWLDGNTHNRPIRQSKVDRYARDMRLGRWMVTHQGIAFTKDGTLIDGQHRLWAVIESETTVKMLVLHGLSMETQTVIDTAVSRDTRDRLWLSDRFGDVSMAEASVLKRFLRGSGDWPALTVSEELEAFSKHRAAIQFAIRAFPGRKKRITSAPVYAVVARSWYVTARRKDIERFCHVLFTGEALTDPEKTAVLMRDILLQGEPTKPAYRKMSVALRAFLDDKRLKKIYPAMGEIFLLPGERPSVQKPLTGRRYGLLDLAMAHLRATGESTVRQLCTALKMHHRNAGQLKAALDNQVTLGLLSATSGKGPRRATVYVVPAGRH